MSESGTLVELLGGCAAIESLTALLARRGFRVQGHIRELFGLYARCQAALRGTA
ncbi:MAG: hypothetical protein HC828_00610 [Blastochloris sp.]|nr:hypothetical protein [Blastochloris sp.]